jgi:beta-glucuronidase
MWYFISNLRDYVRRLHTDLDDNYPDGRLVTQSLAADGASMTGSSQLDVDVAGWTMYFGVFYGQDITTETMAFLEEQHDAMPDKPMLACEYGYWSGSGGSEEPEQVRIAGETLDGLLPYAALNTDGEVTDGFLCAVTWWCQFNWYRNQSPHIQSMGVTKMDRQTHKPVQQTLSDRYGPYFETGGTAKQGWEGRMQPFR